MTFTSRAALAALAATNRPRQLDLLDHVADHLAASPAVTHLMVRGSLATGTSDRLSDVDLVVGIAPAHFASMVAVRDALATALGAIMPGWPDTIVPRMGGLGYVYLVVHQGQLHQLDLYLAPAYRIEHITGLTRGRIIYANPEAEPAQPDRAVDDFVRERLEVPPSCTELLTEALVLAWMIRKRITRRQRFMAYAERHQLVTAVRSLIRTALQPAAAFYGWYHLDDLAVTSLGRACLDGLGELVAAEPVPTLASLATTVDRILTIARRAAPEVVHQLQAPVEAYLHHLDAA